jgi:hypothetical protein
MSVEQAVTEIVGLNEVDWRDNMSTQFESHKV